jgi:para-nitrobenzyl esterase
MLRQALAGLAPVSGAPVLGALVLGALVLGVSASAEAQPVVASTSSGQLAGTADRGALVFRGIPYAAPPVGELRWRPPQPPASWSGLRDATAFGPACPQTPNSPVMMVGPVGASSEDCLTLNVWMPANAAPGAKLPVMVWIHGGGFFTGSGSERQFDGEPYVARGIVFVAINYRLGRLGFFAHPALDAEHPDELHGNYGLMDQIAALKWVKANIAGFGGDPGNVTVFGESAGGISILALMATPLAQGLFEKAIVESGAFPGPMREIAEDQPGRPSSEAMGKAFAEAHGINGPEAAAALRALPVEAIAPSKPAGMEEIGKIQATSAPMIDGKMFAENVFSTFASDRQTKIPLLIGSNSLEALVWLFQPDGKVGTVPILPAGPAVLDRLGPDKDRIVAAYSPRFGGDMAKIVPALVSDMLVGAGTRFIAGRSAGVQPTYLYRFETVPAPLREVTAGAPHGAEIPYVFGVLYSLRNVGPRTTDADRALSATVIDYWTSFARTGNPNGNGRPNWPALAAGDEGLMLRFTDAGPVAGSALPNSVSPLFQQSLAAQFARQSQ